MTNVPTDPEFQDQDEWRRERENSYDVQKCGEIEFVPFHERQLQRQL